MRAFLSFSEFANRAFKENITVAATVKKSVTWAIDIKGLTVEKSPWEAFILIASSPEPMTTNKQIAPERPSSAEKTFTIN